MKKCIFLIFTVILILFSICAVTASDDNMANTNSIENNRNIDQSFNDLQLLVDLSRSGDVIYLNGTTFRAIEDDTSVSIDKDLTLNGASISDKTLKATIDGNQLLRIMTVSNNRKLTLLNINFVNGIVDGSGAVISTGSYSTIKIGNCNFSDNYATANGAVIRAERGAAIDIDRSSFSNNFALGNGGVISGGYGVELTINDSTFINNTAQNLGEGGGVIFGATQSKINISNSIFKDNSANYDGGVIYADSNSVINSYYNLFINSSSLSSGGVIAAINSKINVIGSIFRKNNVKYYGGTIYGASNSIVNISDSTFEDNLVGRYGGAVYSAATCTVSNSIFTNNTSNSTLIGDGGVIYSLADVNIDNSKFFDNRVHNGKCGVIYGTSGVSVMNSLFVNSFSDDDAGVIYGISGLISVINSTFINSTAVSDGAVIYADQDVYVDNCTFINSTCYGDGGVIYGNLDITVIGSTFVNSYANNSGGVIYGWSKINITNSTFINSNSNNFGGVISGDMGVNITSCEFINNTAGYGGGVVNVGENANMVVLNSTFYQNHAEAGAAIGGGNNTIIENSTFIENYGVYGTLYIIKGEVKSSKFIKNTCINGGAIYCEDSVKINNSYFEANQGIFGGAIRGQNIIIDSSEFKNNSAHYGGAVQGLPGSNIVVNNSNFTINYGSEGGAIHNINSLEVYNSTFINNTAELKGSAINSYQGSEIISNSKFSNINETNGTAVIYLEASFKTNLTGNEILTNILPIFANGNIVSPTVLEFLNASGHINESIELSAFLKDDNGNIIGSDSIIEGTIDNQTIIYYYDNETYSFKANHTMNKYGKFNINGTYSYCDNLTIKVGILTIFIKTNILANDLVKYYHNGTDLVFQLVDVNYIELANQTIGILINGVNYTRTTSDDGFARMAINLGVGNHTVQLFFEGHELYAPSNKTINVEVLSTIISENLVKYYHNDSQFIITVLKGDGIPVIGGYVKFNINGVFYERFTKLDGTAKLNINLNPGEYVITTMFEDLMVSNNITVLSYILSDNLVKYFHNGSQFVVRVMNKEGFVAVGQNVTFNINGVFYQRTTDVNGTVKLNINLNPGVYVITTIVDDLLISNEINILSTIISDNLVMSSLNRVPFEVSVLDGQGNPAVGKNLTFNINGVIYNRISDNEGSAKININLMSGKYIMTTIYDELMQSNIITILEGI